jgi:hypothetical protein
MSLNALRDECLRRGMNTNSFYQYVTYSPVICRLAREVYSLVGAEIPPGLVEEISRPSVRGQVLVGNGWTEDGRIWISYRLNTSNLRTGAFALPTNLAGILVGQYFVHSSGTGARSSILAGNDRLTGLHRAVAIRGGEPGDVIVVTFDLSKLSAEIRFGDEANGEADLQTPTPSPSTSLLGTPLNEASLALGIEGVTPVSETEEWQPIATAPHEQDLKVRLEDAVGRYPLLFPCKLISGLGWINSWLETPLAADPVDWRDWDEPAIEF